MKTLSIGIMVGIGVLWGYGCEPRLGDEMVLDEQSAAETDPTMTEADDEQSPQGMTPMCDTPCAEKKKLSEIKDKSAVLGFGSAVDDFSQNSALKMELGQPAYGLFEVVKGASTFQIHARRKNPDPAHKKEIQLSLYRVRANGDLCLQKRVNGTEQATMPLRTKLGGRYALEVSTKTSSEKPIYMLVSLTCTEGQCLGGAPAQPGGNPQATIKKISAGDNATLAVLTDGRLMVWGQNSFGQLGLGTFNDQTVTPTVVPGLAGVRQACGGDNYSCVLLGNGTIECAGANQVGQLGDGTTTGRTTFAGVRGLSGITQIACGYLHACARSTNGALFCWGQNFAGELGTGSPNIYNTPQTAGYSLDAVDVVAGVARTCYRNTAGELYCVGTNDSRQLEVEGSPITQFRRLQPRGVAGIAMNSEICVVRADGIIQCIGENTRGQLGDGTTQGGDGVWRTVRNINPAKQVVTHAQGACALLEDGTVWCWGWNNDGQLGDGSGVDQASPVRVKGLAGAVQLAAGGRHVCALLKDGSVSCWGMNLVGQLGDGTTTNAFTPVKMKR